MWAQSQSTFCVPISFDQELVLQGTGPTLIPLSLTANNPERVRGILKIKFNTNLSAAGYKLYVFNSINRMNRITDAHLHFASANQNGPVVVDLYDGNPVNSNGLLSQGTITNKNVYNMRLNIVNSVSSLYQAILDGSIYVNVHSELFQAGLIRGQIYTH